MKGFFITFEGGEGSGKSTQSRLLCDLLKAKGYKVIRTREPGGTKLSEAVRRILLDPDNKITPVAELFLYETARTQHIAEIVKPALEAGGIVVCDRFTDATIAYQGYARGLDVTVIRKLNRIATFGIEPDLTIYLDISPEKGLNKARGIKKDFVKPCDRLEGEGISFHRLVRKGYLALAKSEPRRIKVIRTADTIAKTHRHIVKTVLGQMKKI